MIKNLLKKISSSINYSELVAIISDQQKTPPRIIKKGILQGQLKIDGSIVKSLNSVSSKSNIRFQNQNILVKTESQFDLFVNHILNDVIGHDNLEDLYDDQEKILFSYIMQYFIEVGYKVDELLESEWNMPILNKLKDFSQKRNLIQSNTKRKDLVDEIKRNIGQAIRDTELLISHFDKNELTGDKRILNDFGRTLKNTYLLQFVYPLLSKVNVDLFISSIKSLQDLNNSHSEVDTISKNESLKRILEDCKKSLNQSPDIKFNWVLNELLKSIERKSREKVGDIESGNPEIQIIEEQRTYDIQNFPIKVYLNLKNSGDGIARDIRVGHSNEKTLLNISILPTNQIRKASFNIDRSTYSLREDGQIDLFIKYFSESREEFNFSYNLLIKPQNEDLPWENLKRQKPYVIGVIKDKNKFYGRENLLSDLHWNIVESSIMSSYIIYGQKRIGKSSIVRTLEDTVKDNPNIIFCYVSVGSIKHVQASKSFQNLSIAISKKILTQYRKGFDLSFQYDVDSSQESLADLIRLIEELSNIHDDLRFVIAIDEFDELNPEFFRDSEIGETLALNLGKGLNDMDHVSIFLIGSETMDTKSKQSMRLNTFESKRVDIFAKETEFNQFAKIVTQPTKTCLEFDPVVVDWLYDFTNGNPYFTNLLCLAIFDVAYEIKRSYIDEDFAFDVVNKAINQFSKKEFEHFWVDGLSEEDEILYKKYLERRQRVLFAVATVLKEGLDASWQTIKRKIKRPLDYAVTDIQWDETYHEFINRGIFKTNGSQTAIVPRLFQEWLTDKGLYQVIAEIENREEFIDKLNEEDKLRLSDEEISEIQKRLGDDISSIQLREFFNQIESIPHRRNIADLLKEILFIGADQLSKHLKTAYANIWEGPLVVSKSGKVQRIDGEIVCLDSSYRQNQSSYNLIRESFKFPSNKEMKRASEIQNINYASLKHLIFFEPMIDCPYYYRNSISLLLKKIKPELVNDITIHILTFVISDDAYGELQDLMTNNFAFDFKFHFPQTYQRNELSPFFTEDIRNSEPWTPISNHYQGTSHTSSFIKIGSTVPYQSFPFMWLAQSRKKPLVHSNESSAFDYQLFMSTSLGIQELNLGSESGDREFKGSLAYPIKNHKRIFDLTRKLKNAKSEDAKEGIIQTISEESKIPRRKSPELMHSVAKTLAAFYNTDGGVLYVGIEDDLTVIGLEADMAGKSYSEEEIRKISENICSEYLGNEFSSSFKVEFLNIGEHKILKINVKKGNQKMWVKRGDDGKQLMDSDYQFFIRRTQSSVKLSAKELVGWMENRVNE